ncbi:alpha/beta hydrolase family protein [Pseudomonas sp. Fl4BN1]|uniref:alpha/beta hydrolase family protein n=1 Tax=Pseudomonas sp. Fl4BN1 TaxID=2697651 RepID=UPI001378DB63|nr:alpha/beta fold hydrolase [Pseudomonas sp. Fl4BN1]NBF07840.1 alpha/beta hydrolase [Pseudomonas sp. Fl4BN1]
MKTTTGTPPPSIPCESLVLVARDGYRLAALRYLAAGQVKGNLLVASATGVPQRFYRRFAEHAARQGFNVLTLDYRGIAQSKPDSLKGFAMAYLDWAHLDLAAAVDLLSQEALPLYWVGHSFGGHAIGLLPNHQALTACYNLGTGAGWSGWMPRTEALKVRLFWNLIMPPIVAWKGYMAWSLLGMGVDLPLGVYRDWKHWCTYPNYFFDDPAMPHLPALYASVRTPCVFASAVDDLWAPPRSRDAFVKHYRNAPQIHLDLQPRAGARPIGHMGYFRDDSMPLWDEILDWLQGHRTLPSEARADATAPACS